MASAQAEQLKRDVESVLDKVADATGITALADWLRAKVPAAVKRIADSQPCMDPGTCGQQIVIQQQVNGADKNNAAANQGQGNRDNRSPIRHNPQSMIRKRNKMEGVGKIRVGM